MATKKNSTNNSPKILNIVGDVALIATMLTCAISLLLFALTLAQKVTITVGK